MSNRRIGLVLVLMFGVAGAGVHPSEAQTADGLSKTSGKEPVRVPVAASPLITDPRLADYTMDLRPLMLKKNLEEGRTFVTRSPEGLRVFAVVEEGGLVDLEVKDSYGDLLDQLEVWGRDRDRRSQGSTVGSKSKTDEVHCWRCYAYGGETHCFEIVCPPKKEDDAAK
jgi:hypothetical protein